VDSFLKAFYVLTADSAIELAHESAVGVGVGDSSDYQKDWDRGAEVAPKSNELRNYCAADSRDRAWTILFAATPLHRQAESTAQPLPRGLGKRAVLATFEFKPQRP
jgi:hypothetical protein